MRLMRPFRRSNRIALLVCLAAPPAWADGRTGLLAPRALEARRLDGAIQIDGVLDEPAWTAAPVGDRFIQQQPAPGNEASLRTDVRVLFDDAAVYVGVRLFDPAPGAIQAPLGRRDDENNSDWCFVEIDSRHDRRTAFSFGVNPAGVQVDGVFVNDTDFDSSWNGVWESAASTDAGGWSVEYRIPFAVLPFHAASPMTWGLNVYRSNPRTGEVSNWSPRTPELAGVVSLFNDLAIAAAPHVRRFDVTPYVSVEAGDGPQVHGGADLGVALGPGAALIATVLPDFGQVEADPTQLNLTSYQLFQTERRPFFTEGIDAFRFDTSLPLVSRGDSFVEETPFYSRRIGRAPDNASATTILGAAKLFGRTESGWRAGVLAAWTLGADAVAPPAQSVVARVVKETGDGNASVGVFASGLSRATDDPALAAALPRRDGAIGLDGRIRFADQTYEARAWLLATGQVGTADAIAKLAAQPWHDLERPDAPRLHLAPGATSLAGGAGELRLAKVGGELHASLAARAISPRFDVDGLGFQRNSDWIVLAAQWERSWYPRARVIRSWRIGSDNAGLGWSWGGERRAAVVDAFAAIDFASYWDATLTVQHEARVLSTEWLRGGPALALPPRELVRLSIHTDTRRLTFGGLDVTVASEPGSGSRDATLAPSLTWRLTDHVGGTLTASYLDQWIGRQYVAGPGIAPAATYLVGRVHQRTASLALQVDAAVSSRLIFQLYAQPFATQGRYDRYAEVVDAHAGGFADVAAQLDGTMVTIDDGMASWTFARPDGTQRSLIASAVARWEVRPGSFLTAVWSHRGAGTRTDVGYLGPALARSISDPGGDIVLVKLAWRIAP